MANDDAEDLHGLETRHPDRSGGGARPPALHDLFEDSSQWDRDLPPRVVRSHFPQVGDGADVITFPRLVEILVATRLTREAAGGFERFQDGAGVVAAAAQVVDLGQP